MTKTFTENTFFDINKKEVVPKDIVVIDASDGEPESFPDNQILLLKSYKSNIERGRKDPLKGRDVFVLPTAKGPYFIPTDEAESFAKNLYSLSLAVKNN